MKKIILLISLLSVVISGCAKPQIVRIFPADEVSKMDMNKVLEDKDLSNEEKIQIIQMKLSEDIERKKRAVEAEKDNKLSSIINNPVAPLRTPDTILRVLILPYEDDNGVLNGWKYSYVKVDDGKWIMADYLNGTKPSLRGTLTPLNSGEEKSGNIKGVSMAPPITNDDVKTFSQYSEELKQEKEELEQKQKKEKKADKGEQQPKEADRERAAVDNKSNIKDSDITTEKDNTNNPSVNEQAEINKEPALNEIIIIDKNKSNEKKDTVLSSENNKASIKDDTDKKEPAENVEKETANINNKSDAKKNTNKYDKKDMKLKTQEKTEDTVVVDDIHTYNQELKKKSVEKTDKQDTKEDVKQEKDAETNSAVKTDDAPQLKDAANNNISVAEDKKEKENTVNNTNKSVVEKETNNKDTGSSVDKTGSIKTKEQYKKDDTDSEKKETEQKQEAGDKSEIDKNNNINEAVGKAIKENKKLDTVSDADTDNIGIIPNRSIRNENRPNLFQIN